LTLMPVFTGEGKLPGYCSSHWKARVCQRWYRLQGVQACTQWLGFSLDEQHRCKPNECGWITNAFPLIDRGITREGCKKIIEKAGLPPAHKSRCWQCPHQTPEEWLEVRADPEEWAAAVALDQQIRDSDPEGRGDLFLYSGRVPLPLADFQADIDKALPPLFRACEGGNCWT
jgi:hypothetical protein